MQPNREITREELAVVMMRYAKSCGIAGADAEPREGGSPTGPMFPVSR